MSVRVFLVDDEAHCLELLAYALEHECPDVEVVGMSSSPVTAQKMILAENPDLVFLDISMPEMTGFELLEQLRPWSFAVIFCTAYDQYAIDALRVTAVDYLLKPLDEGELVKAVARARQRIAEEQTQAGLAELMTLTQVPVARPTVALPSAQGLEFVPQDQILYCQSDGNYCHVILEDGARILVSKKLKEIEAKLQQEQFFRIHHSYLVNLSKIRRYLKADGGLLQMQNGDLVKISRAKKEEFLARF